MARRSVRAACAGTATQTVNGERDLVRNDNPLPLVSAVIVTYNSCDDIAACLDALLASDWPRLEIIVVDNASVDGTANLVARSHRTVRLVRAQSNLGFAGGNNLGFAQCQGDIVVAVNPDVQLLPAALRAFVYAFGADSTLGVAGAKLLYPDRRTIQHAGGVVDFPLATTHHRGYGEPDSGQYDQPCAVDFVTGAALALRRQALTALGGFDAAFRPVYYEDVDLCYRARAAGWGVRYHPTVVGLHRTSVSLDPAGETYFRYFHANRVRFVLKHCTTEQILAGFLPAEGARLRAPLPVADRFASHLVYHNLGDKRMTVPQSDTGREHGEDLERLIGDLSGRWQVSEQPFVSHAPLIGPLIARFRAAWNSVSTRWYVQPMLQQQVEFNAALVRTVAELARRVDAQETLALASRGMLGQRLLEVEDRLKRIEHGAGSRE